MIIVSGRLYVQPGMQQEFVARSADAVAQARRTPGCHDFVVAADSLDAERVNVYEEWATEAALLAFRGSGPDDDLGAYIVRAEVMQHVVASSSPA